MTLFMATPTRDGVVLAADKRTWDPLRGVRDDQEKVVLLGTHSAFATTGLPCYERFFLQPPAPPGVRRFLIECTPAGRVSAEEAVEFSRFFIQECSHRTPLVDGSAYQIGPSCDVAVIRKDSGFTWLR